MKIGFFDSGLGGLLVLKAVAKVLPQYDYYYYGDTKNVPFGDKTEAEILTYTKEGVEYLFEQDCALVIIACNTSSAESLRTLQDTYLVENYPDRRILGVIIPAVEEILESDAKYPLLLATKRTIDSNKYEKELSKRSESPVMLSGVATPELVPLIESHQIDKAIEVAKSAIEKTESAVGEVDTVILGCTHYGLLKEELRNEYKGSIKFISQDELIPAKLTNYLNNHAEIEKQISQNGQRKIHLTEHRGDYDSLIKEFLNGQFLGEE